MKTIMVILAILNMVFAIHTYYKKEKNDLDIIQMIISSFVAGLCATSALYI